MTIDEIPDTATTQILYIGADETIAEGLARSSQAEAGLLRVAANEWMNADWQAHRAAGQALAVVDLAGLGSFQDFLQCVQAVSIAYRPRRLLVVDRALGPEKVLFLIKAGADGVVGEQATAEEILAALDAPGINHEDLFPNPVRWLNSLVRAAEELTLGQDLERQVRRLLNLFASQLGVTRASVATFDDGALRFLATVGMPPGVVPGMELQPAPSSITAWVLENRRARLIEGEYVGGGNRPSQDVRSAVCAPLLAGGEIHGVVNLSSLKGGRFLNPADLATAEVFASLLALTISNHRLHCSLLDNARLATMGSTLASMSHCVKNLITILRGSNMIMQRGLETQDFAQVLSGHRINQKGVSRMESLVMDLLDFSKARTPDLRTVMIEEILSQVAESFDVLNFNNSHCLELGNRIMIPCQLDDSRLLRAILNLVSNAIDATPRGGIIRVEVWREADRLMVAVEDNGPGVPKENLPTIFSPFFSTKGSKGTGLGLAMVAKYCEESGGRAVADESPELGGLRITMQLPFVTEEATRQPHDEPE